MMRRFQWSGMVVVCAITLATLAGAFAAEPLRVMTFNVRYGTAEDGAHVWTNRRPVLLEVIKKFDPDLLGVQEALHFQLEELVAGLDGYAWVGVGRDDGVEAGEYSAILYRKSRLKPAESGTFWFSETPTVPASKGWGNHIPRICTWGVFDDLAADGAAKRFRAYNVHWDHESEPANVKMGRLLAARIGDECGDRTPAIVTGDFNSTQTSPAYTTLFGGPAGIYDTLLRLHPDEKELRSFHGYEGGSAGDKIDGVLASRQWETKEAAIVRTSKEGLYPSDHYPVTAVLMLRVTPRSSEGSGK